MQPTLRVLIWLLAVVFAASPVLLAVISSPSHQGDLFVGASYASYSRDVAFILVAVISIGMIDALEVLATYFGPRPAKAWVGCLALVLVIVFIPLLMVLVTWASPGVHMTDRDLHDIGVLAGASLVCAFGARTVAILGG